MARHHMIDGVKVPFTAAEEAARDAEEVAWEAGQFDREMDRLRSSRTQRLSETDWYGLKDVTMPDAMTAYRQDLRDITEGLTTVEQVQAVSWPVKP